MDINQKRKQRVFFIFYSNILQRYLLFQMDTFD